MKYNITKSFSYSSDTKSYSFDFPEVQWTVDKENSSDGFYHYWTVLKYSEYQDIIDELNEDICILPNDIVIFSLSNTHFEQEPELISIKEMNDRINLDDFIYVNYNTLTGNIISMYKFKYMYNPDNLQVIRLIPNGFITEHNNTFDISFLDVEGCNYSLSDYTSTSVMSGHEAHEYWNSMLAKIISASLFDSKYVNPICKFDKFSKQRQNM